MSDKLSESSATFALDLYSQIVSENNESNVFFSPVSISLALAMTLVGTRANSKDELKQALHFTDIDDKDVHKSFGELVTLLNGVGQSDFTLNLANKLFGEKSYKFLENFLNDTTKYYGAKLELVNFISNAKGAENLINNWVSEKTQGKIPIIIPPGVLDSLTRLVLVNAIYFKGTWSRKFDEARTSDADFHVTSNETVKVKMMHMKAKFFLGHNHNLEAQVLELPYLGERLSMLIMLPTQGGMVKLEKGLTSDILLDPYKANEMRKSEVNVFLPKFELDLKLSLNKILQKLGISDIFNESKADLSGMDGTKDLSISHALHRAYVKVNEKGTEAAAATAIVIQCRMATLTETFKVDRPFLFYILDLKTNTVLFLGKFIRP